MTASDVRCSVCNVELLVPDTAFVNYCREEQGFPNHDAGVIENFLSRLLSIASDFVERH